MDENVSVAGLESVGKTGTIKKMSFTRIVAVPQAEHLSKRASNQMVTSAAKQVSPAVHASGEDSLTSSLADLNIQSTETRSPDAPKLDDERTHISVSSMHAQSIVSGLASALDEKESIRPDDSASVQATEDDDSNSGPNSGPGSGAQNSRTGSEAGAKAFQSQLREISAQKSIPFASKIEDGQLAVPPQFSFWMPDEKLIEALSSPKDRLFLLQLEQQIIVFVQDPIQATMELPPYNSFLRLLAHRLADYYRLTHFVDMTTNAVRVCKTPNTQLPTPLSALRSAASSESLPLPAPSLKIMRRLGPDGQLAEIVPNTTANSTAPSKATSEGSEQGDSIASPPESVTTKDKASQARELREAKYKEARDRIFAGFKEEEKDQSADASAEASRASSVTGNKKKKKKPKDDDFEARSAYYRQQPYDASATRGSYFMPYMAQPGPTMVQPMYTTVYQPQYPIMQQPQMMPQGMVSPPAGTVVYQPATQPYATYGMPHQQQMMSSYYPQMQPVQGQVQYVPQYVQQAYGPVPISMSRPGSQMSESSWGQQSAGNQYPAIVNSQPLYTNQSPQLTPSPGGSNISVPYAYGQLPYQPHSPNNKNAHPLPGSYQRQNYNAQARSFSSYNQQGQAPQIQFGFTQPMAVPSGQHGTSTFGNANTALPRKHTPHTMQTPPGSTISKWGTPSTLPPKPPPPAATRVHDSSMPTYHQNGTYSKPNNSPHDARALK